METTTATETTTAALRRYFKIGPRTRRFRNGQDLHAEMFEAITLAATMPGYHTERTEQALRQGFSIALAWDKFVAGGRLPGVTTYALTSLSPYRLSALIGRMIEAGVTCNGEAERWFRANRDEIEGWAR